MSIGEQDKSSDSPPDTGSIQSHQDDVVILVVGRTGAGKSSFIKLVSGDSSVSIGHNLRSGTSEIQIVRFADSSGRNVVLVDTPGFGDSRNGFSDANILDKITEFLLESYDKSRMLKGIIYCHRITDNRFKSQSSVNLETFEGLCGSRNFKNVVVLTTCWDKIPEDLGTREAELKTSFFKALVDGGACFMRHNNTEDTARDVLNHIFTFQPSNLLIQEEIRLQGKSLENTTAGSVHGEESERLKAEYQKKIEDLEDANYLAEELNRLLRDKVEALRQRTAQQQQRMEEQQQRMEEQQQRMEQLQQRMEKQQQRMEQQQQERDMLKETTRWDEVVLEVAKIIAQGLQWWNANSKTPGN